jgi:hypothetical protein
MNLKEAKDEVVPEETGKMGYIQPWEKEVLEWANGIVQRFSNFFQVGTSFISQNVLRTTLLLSP